MSKIMDNLFLSSIIDAKDQKFLKKHNIKYVLIAAKDLKKFFPTEIQYHQLPLKDDPGVKIIRYFPEAFEFIDNAIKKNKSNILVHCLGGKSRSVTIVTGYVMLKKGMKSEEAIKFVRSKHKLAFPNPGFLQQLFLFEKCLNNYFKSREEEKKLGEDEDFKHLKSLVDIGKFLETESLEILTVNKKDFDVKVYVKEEPEIEKKPENKISAEEEDRKMDET